MRICVTSDLHGNLPDIETCDLLLLCGDIVPLRMQRNIPQSKKWLSHEFAQWVNEAPCELVYMVGGNHDFALANMYRDELQKTSILYTPTKHKLTLIDNNFEYYYFEGKEYVIWGTPYCKIFGNWAYMYEPETLKEAYATMPEHCDIVLTHDAPKLCGLGVIHQSMDQENAGNPWLADEILRKHPKYVFCGHIHSGEHNLQKLDDIHLANVSLVDESYTVAYKPLYINV